MWLVVTWNRGAVDLSESNFYYTSVIAADWTPHLWESLLRKGRRVNVLGLLISLRVAKIILP